jgi:para-nitrobenzyl esterase
MADGPIVETAAGRVRGRVEAGLAVFRGIPFTSRQSGARRFAAPEPPAPWAGVRDAQAFGAAPPQASDVLLERLGLFPRVAQGEDGLAINVWTPACDGAGRPVLVWIHGGAFQSGSGSLPLYDGARLAARGDVVVVTLDYRVGALGFLHLADRPGVEAASNLGLQDQIAALRWVRAHADRFGGDPRRICVFGESAGAGSIVALLAMPSARGLFRRAIVQSAAPNGMIAAAAARERAERFLAALGPRDATRLRETPAAALLAAQQALMLAGPWKMDMPFVPVVDGVLVPRFPLAAIADAAGDDVDLVIGTTDDEMRLYACFEAPDSIGEKEALRRLALELPGSGDADRVYHAFRAIRAGRGAPHAPADLLWAVQTEVRLRHHSTAIAEARAARGAPAFAYRFGWRSPDAGGRLGACHALDLPFTFGNLDAPGMAAFTGGGAGAQALARDWMDAWCAFARSGDPSHAAIGAWPRYDAARRATYHFGAERRVADAPDDAERAVLAKVDWAALP